MTETFIKSFTHLKDMPKADRALTMLQRVASLVKPIMRKHGWVLPTLAEFFPDSPNLLGEHLWSTLITAAQDRAAGLNVNGGEQILLRLRPAFDPDAFLEEDPVVRTMLHELTHNVHGPHDEKFYKFLAGLEDEYEALQRSGYAGEGFFTPGHRLGTGISHNPPPHLSRVRVLEAAERRRRAEILTQGGGRLGGRSSALDKLSPRELAARAAERRRRDEVACGSGPSALREAAKAAKASAVNNVIDLTNDDNTPVTHGPSGLKPGPSRSATTSRNTANPPIGGEWTCPVCTLVNSELALQCDACLAVRPFDTSVSPVVSTGWTCAICGERDIPHQFWSCGFCGAIKSRS